MPASPGLAAVVAATLLSSVVVQAGRLGSADSRAVLATERRSPVQRVVKLLKDMKVQLLEEASKESEMYDKMVCWCETGEKEKTRAIATAEVKISDLESSIQAMSAKFGSVGTDIEALKKQISADIDALKEVTAIREEEAAKFREEEKDMVQALTNLNNAIIVLSRHHGGGDLSLLQLDGPTRASLRSVLRNVAVTYDMRIGSLPPQASKARSMSLLSVAEGDTSRRLQEAFGLSTASALDMPARFAQEQLADRASEAGAQAASFLQNSGRLLPTSGSYSPQSGAIFGILEQMKQEFEKNLKIEQKTEAKAVEDFAELKKAKTEQIESGKETLDMMEGEHAANIKALSDAKEDLELTRKQRSEDVEYLRKLRLTCQDLDNQWEERTKTRGEETEAVSQAIAILTEDDAREHLAKSITLLQIESSSGAEATMRMRRRTAARALRRAADDLDFDADDLLSAWRSRGGRKVKGSEGGPKARLSVLAVSVELDEFKEVKKAMDKMIVDLKAQQEEEVQLKAYCQKELAANEKMNYTKTEHKEDLASNIATLEKSIEKLQKEIQAAKAAIAKNNEAIKSASQTRQAENKEFQQVVSDQRAAQSILKKALLRLEAFYKKEALLQQHDDQTPPVQFTTYNKNAGGVSVMGLIEQVIRDSVALEKDVTSEEKTAQADYESFVVDATEEIKTLSEAITMKTKAIADAKVEKEDAKSDLAATEGELASLAQANIDLHGECDFTLENFDIRQKARLQEIEAIQGAKAILSGDRR